MTSLTSHTSRGSVELPALVTESSSSPNTLPTDKSGCVLHSQTANLSAPTVKPDSNSTADKHPRAPGSSPKRVMAVKGMVPILVGMMLLTGCCNTLLTKYQVHRSLKVTA